MTKYALGLIKSDELTSIERELKKSVLIKLEQQAPVQII